METVIMPFSQGFAEAVENQKNLREFTAEFERVLLLEAKQWNIPETYYLPILREAVNIVFDERGTTDAILEKLSANFKRIQSAAKINVLFEFEIDAWDDRTGLFDERREVYPASHSIFHWHIPGFECTGTTDEQYQKFLDSPYAFDAQKSGPKMTLQVLRRQPTFRPQGDFRRDNGYEDKDQFWYRKMTYGHILQSLLLPKESMVIPENRIVQILFGEYLALLKEKAEVTQASFIVQLGTKEYGVINYEWNKNVAGVYQGAGLRVGINTELALSETIESLIYIVPKRNEI